MDNGSYSDDKIINKVKDGDIDSFRVIVKRYQEQVFSIGMRFFRNKDDSYDFVQDVFIKAFNNVESFRGVSEFRFWLYKIAYNHGINAVKAKVADQTLVEQSLVDRKQIPEKVHLTEEIKGALLSAIEELPENYRICLDFFFFFGLSYTEISNITGFPVNTIKSNVFRAKQLLRDALRGTIAEDYHEM